MILRQMPAKPSTGEASGRKVKATLGQLIDEHDFATSLIRDTCDTVAQLSKPQFNSYRANDEKREKTIQVSVIKGESSLLRHPIHQSVEQVHIALQGFATNADPRTSQIRVGAGEAGLEAGTCTQPPPSTKVGLTG